MIDDEITYRIEKELPFAPSAGQRNAIQAFAAFATSREPRCAMILRGSAGTGKTVLAGAIVRAMAGMRQKTVLLAPTGRAAKVFALNSGHTASTIHRKIYRERSFNGPSGQFNLNDNLHRDTLFIVDEASMVANYAHESTPFGSGRLLDDLINFVYSGRNCRMLLIGDKAQLPPIGETESPALRADVLRAYGLHVSECDLTEVLRQGEGSGILWNATMLRDMITGTTETASLPVVKFKGFADISVVPGNELIDQLASSYATAGLDDTIVITRSNKRANIYNQGIRNTVLGREEMLSTGDILMIVKNKYIEAKESPSTGGGAGGFSKGVGEGSPAFIANGDRGIVRRVRNFRELYGFHFADISIEFPDYDNFELDTTVILDTLTSESPALTRDENDRLFNAVMEDYADVPLKAERMKRMRADDYYNALQVKFGYAVTCHKAQGGQWTDVYIDQGYMTDDMLTPDYLHWLYTAFTRATGHLYLVNWPKQQTM